MSGRWTEISTPWSSLLILDEAIQDLGVEWNRPQILSDLDHWRSQSLELSKSLGNLIALIDDSEFNQELLVKSLDGTDQELNQTLDNIAKDSAKASEQLVKLRELSTQLRIAENQVEALTSECNNFNGSINVGGLQFSKRYGRFTSRYNAQYGNPVRGFNLEALNQKYEHYSKQGIKKIDSVKTGDHQMLEQRITNRLNDMRNASIQASKETLRRDRDRQIMAMAKQQGYSVTRKTKGKKIEYVLNRYKA